MGIDVSQTEDEGEIVRKMTFDQSLLPQQDYIWVSAVRASFIISLAFHS